MEVRGSNRRWSEGRGWFDWPLSKAGARWELQGGFPWRWRWWWGKEADWPLARPTCIDVGLLDRSFLQLFNAGLAFDQDITLGNIRGTQLYSFSLIFLGRWGNEGRAGLPARSPSPTRNRVHTPSD